jgi:hypothetical protein
MDFDTLVYLRDGKHTGLARLLLIEIELFATYHTHRSFPSIARLAHDLGVKPRRVQQILQKLIAEGAVRVVGKGGRGLSNCYQLCDLPSETVQPSAPFSDNGATEEPKGCNLGHEKGATQCTPSSTEKKRKKRGVSLSNTGEKTTDTRPPDDWITFNGTYGHCRRCGKLHQPRECAQEADTLAAD